MEAHMQYYLCPLHRFRVFVTAGVLLIWPSLALSQSASSASSTEPSPDLKSLAALVLQLQSQVQTLSSEVSELRTAQQRAVKDAGELRAELNRTEEKLAAGAVGGYSAPAPPPPQPSSSSAVSTAAKETQGSSGSLDERVSKLENDEDLMNDKIAEQSQTKVESGSKYRVRLSGIVLLNTDVTRGSVDNLDAA